MAKIEIARKHKKSLAEAKAAIERVATKISDKFDVSHEWQGNTLHFERPGVNGRIALVKNEVRVSAELSFLLGAMKGTIERAIEEQIDKELG
jgi:putative polyhydroxyalkanoate system protein